jgi:hypothetical protein
LSLPVPGAGKTTGSVYSLIFGDCLSPTAKPPWRDTYITELLRNGVSLVEARELARHSDVRMTMKYTHIGLDDQAQALAKLRGLTPPLVPAEVATDVAGKPDHKPEGCPRSGHARAVSACQNTSTKGVSGL